MPNQLRQRLAKITGEFVGNFSKQLKLGRGSVIPGRIALMLDPQLLQSKQHLFQKGVVFVTGTNGKSTTAYYISKVLNSLGHTVLTNSDGANLISGIATCCLSLNLPIDYGVFEVDEAYVPKLAQLLKPSHLLVLNLSRDQMDRYNEIETILNKLNNLCSQSDIKLIYNGSNPYTALLGSYAKNSFGYQVISAYNPSIIDQAVCRSCSQGLLIQEATNPIKFSCSHCQWQSKPIEAVAEYHQHLLGLSKKVIGCPSNELADTMTATLLLCQQLSLNTESILTAIERIEPRPAHRVVTYWPETKTSVELVLAKNPDSLNRQLLKLVAKPQTDIVFAINNNIADGRDTSWLWDAEFELLKKSHSQFYVMGQAAADTQLRLKTAGVQSVGLLTTQGLTELFHQPGRAVKIVANYTCYRRLEGLLKHYQSQEQQRNGALPFLLRYREL